MPPWVVRWTTHDFDLFYTLYISDYSLVPNSRPLNLALAGFPQTNALGENLPSCYLNMFNLRLCNAATIRYSILKCGHMRLCGKGYKYFSPHCCKCNSFGCITAIRCGNACHGPHSDSIYSGSEHRHSFSQPPVHPCFARAIELIAHPKIIQILSF